jgi:deoxyribonuclease IV
MYIGAHVSTAGGISNAYQRAKDIGCNAVQIFSASPRIWKRSTISDAEIEKCFAGMKEHGIEKTVIHAIYLVNLASENKELVEKSRDVLEFDLRVDGSLKGSGVVVHVGSHQGRGFDAVKEQLVREISTILSNTPDNSTFLIENSAGQNGKIASDLSEIRWLMDQVQSKRLGWCMDTCHSFAAGYGLTQKGEGKNIFEEIERLNLWEPLKCIHVNDSRDPYDSGRDRHENLGDGHIGSEMLKSFLTEPHIQKVPLMLEVPGIDQKGPDAENVKRLKKLVE